MKQINSLRGSVLVGALIAALVVVVAGGVWYYVATRPPQVTPVAPTPITQNPPVTPTSTNPVVVNTGTTTPNLSRAAGVSAGNNQFALDLYSRYASEKGTNENLFFSPFSISSALAMVYEGAKGQTAQEIGNVFHFPTDIAQTRSGYQSAFASINSGSDLYTLRVANALWAQKNYKLLDTYTSAIKTYYGGSITDVDFVNAPSAAVSTINQWVNTQTAGKIPTILSVNDVNETTKLVLTNAIYFKGSWSVPFEKAATQNKDFTTGSNGHIQVPIMEQTENFDYADTPDAQLLKLGYKGNNVSMFVLLPKGNNLSAFEKTLSSEKIAGWENTTKFSLVDVSLPKFKIETMEHMPSDLEAMGMPTAFSPKDADFSGIATITNPSENLYISDVIHKAFINTDENGTEAAAATAVVMATAAAVMAPPPKPIVFNANHPFMFFIQENQTGNILFVGRVEQL